MHSVPVDLHGNPPAQLWEEFIGVLQKLPAAIKERDRLFATVREKEAEQWRLFAQHKRLKGDVDIPQRIAVMQQWVNDKGEALGRAAGEGLTVTPEGVEHTDVLLEETAACARRLLEKCYHLTRELLRYDGLAPAERAVLRNVWGDSDYRPPIELPPGENRLRAQLDEAQFLTPKRELEIADLIQFAKRKIIPENFDPAAVANSVEPPLAIQKKPRGRPADTDVKEDERIYDAWQTGQYKSYADLANALNKKRREVDLAIDRHEKRIKRQRDK